MPEITPTSADEGITQHVLPRDLAPGDVVSLAWSEGRLSAFDTALVERVTDEEVTLFRPYATTPSFVYGREPSVLPLISSERYQIRRSSTVHVFSRWHNTVVRRSTWTLAHRSPPTGSRKWDNAWAIRQVGQPAFLPDGAATRNLRLATASQFAMPAGAARPLVDTSRPEGLKGTPYEDW